MNSASRILQRLIWGLLIAIVAVIVASFVWDTWVSPKPKLPVFSQVKSFTLTNQFGKSISLDDLKGKVWLADVIFTRCPGPCAAMTRQMRTIQSELGSQSEIAFVSLTADPEFDSPEVLKQYAARNGADAKNWQFLTGPKKALYDFAINELKFTVIDSGEGAKALEDRFLHSTQFVLIDRRARVRGYFDGAQPNARYEIVNAIRAVLRERDA